MSWFLIALIAPALWSASNHADKYIMGKYFKDAGSGSIVIFGTIISLIAAIIILIFQPSVLRISFHTALFIILAGFCYIAALLPYFYAISKDEASRVVPLFQLAPIFSYILALVFLGEVLSLRQIIGGLIIVSGAILLTVEMGESKFRIKGIVLGLMALSSLLFSLNALIFKAAAVNATFWPTAFWQYMGVVLGGSLLLFYTPYRKQFVRTFIKSKSSVAGLVGLSEGLTIGGRLCFYYATTLAPLALVTTVNGFQPAFVFIYGVILTLFFPKVAQESLLKKHLVQKILSIGVLFLGTYIMLK